MLGFIDLICPPFSSEIQHFEECSPHFDPFNPTYADFPNFVVEMTCLENLFYSALNALAPIDER